VSGDAALIFACHRVWSNYDAFVMKDLTTDSIPHHLLSLAMPALAGMVTQIAYQLVDLYFITRLGVAATAGANAAGTAVFVVAALATALSAGTSPLIGHAVGRKDQAQANLHFNQAFGIAIALGVIVMTALSVLQDSYANWIAADSATAATGSQFISWMTPGLSLTFLMTVLDAGLRGTGTVRPGIVISMVTVISNIALAPILIAGWGTGVALGIRGAGLATTLSIAIGVVLYGAYFYRYERYLTIRPELIRPQLHCWRRIAALGMPAGTEIILLFISVAVVYYAIRGFGATAQAGFGIGSRVFYLILLPTMAIAMAVNPIAAQNFGIKNSTRVIQTFQNAATMGTLFTFALTLLVQWRAEAFVHLFGTDSATVTAAALFLKTISWMFVAQGLVYVCASMFQALGNTVPSLKSSALRFVVFCVSLMWLSLRPAFHIEQVWYVLIASVILQAIASLWLLRTQFKTLLLPVSR
jgi:putative MATE family efflux protein